MKTTDIKRQLRIRIATPEDAARLVAIYAPYVEQTAITFEYDVPAEAEFTRRLAEHNTVYPWLVWEEDGRVSAPHFRDSSMQMQPRRCRMLYTLFLQICSPYCCAVHDIFLLTAPKIFSKNSSPSPLDKGKKYDYNALNFKRQTCEEEE